MVGLMASSPQHDAILQDEINTIATTTARNVHTDNESLVFVHPSYIHLARGELIHRATYRNTPSVMSPRVSDYLSSL